VNGLILAADKKCYDVYKTGRHETEYLAELKRLNPLAAFRFQSEGKPSHIRRVARLLADHYKTDVPVLIAYQFNFYPSPDGERMIAKRKKDPLPLPGWRNDISEFSYVFPPGALERKYGFLETAGRILIALSNGYDAANIEGQRYLIRSGRFSDPDGPDLKSFLNKQFSSGFRPVRFYPKLPGGLQTDLKSTSKNSDMRRAYESYARRINPHLWLLFDRYRNDVSDEPAFGFGPAPEYGDGWPEVINVSDDEHLVRLYRQAMYQDRGPKFSYRYETPLLHFKFSFVTGATNEGLKKVFRLFKHDVVMPYGHSTLIAQAWANVFGQFCPITKFPCPELKPCDLLKVPFDPTRSSGIVPNVASVEDHGAYTIRYVTQATKADSLQAAVSEHGAVLAKLKEIGIGHYCGNVKRKDLVALFVKAEIREPTADPEKVRLIFIATTYKFLLDHMIYSEPARKMFLNNGVLIGWSKAHGGMQFLHESLTRDWDCHFVLEADVEKLDFHIKPQLLALVLSFPLMFYDQNDPNWPLVRWFLEWSIDTGTSKYLQAFAGTVYMVIGQMFSGELYTSIGDTLYVLIAYMAFHIYVYHQLVGRGDHATAEAWRQFVRYMWVYGDDTIGVFPSYVYEFVVGKRWEERLPGDKPEALDRFMREVVGIGLKTSDSFVFFRTDKVQDPLLSVPSADGDLEVKGPKILQRHFIKETINIQSLSLYGTVFESDGRWFSEFGGELKYVDCILPYRPLRAYYCRASVSAGDNSNLALIAKLRGLAFDTAGTNLAAYRFLHHVHSELCALEASDDLELRLSQFLEDKDKSLDVYKRAESSSFEIRELLGGFPKQGVVLSKHVPDMQVVADFHAGIYVPAKPTTGSHLGDAAARSFRYPMGGHYGGK
jgi:hypothetical protein